jgi:hypothetical protein
MIQITLDKLPQRIWFAKNTKTGKAQIRFSRGEVRDIRDDAKAKGEAMTIGSYATPTVATHG